MARPRRAAEAGEVACGGSANAPAFRQDAFAGRRTGFSPRAKYIYIGRDNRDVVWSLYNHHSNANQKWYDALNLTPGLVGPPIEPPPADIRQYWHDWLDRDGFPFWSPWENIRSWREIRDLPNVTFVHFNQLNTWLATGVGLD